MLIASDAARIPLSENHCDNESLNADRIGDLVPRRLRGVARKNPQNEVVRDGTTLNVGNDIVGKKQRHHPGLRSVDACGVTGERSLDDEV